MDTEGYFTKYANRTRMEFDRRSPRLRLSLVGYCLEQGIVPDVEQITALADYVGGDLDSFLEDVQNLPIVEEDEEEKSNVDRNGYDVLGRSTYL